MPSPTESFACFDLPNVQAHISRAAEYGAECAARTARSEVDGFTRITCIGKSTSPIEMIFAAWWYAVQYDDAFYRLDLKAQHEVRVGRARYVVDFIVEPEYTYKLDGFPLRIGIELDGHDFHEKTKAQVIHRNARDRALQAAGWKMFHISGSELHRDPRACVDGVRRDVTRLHDEAMAARLAINA